MRTGQKLEKGRTGKRTHYIRLKTRYADNNIGDGVVAHQLGFLRNREQKQTRLTNFSPSNSDENGTQARKVKDRETYTLYSFETRYADNNIGDGAGDEVDEMRDIMPLGAVNNVSNARNKECCEN